MTPEIDVNDVLVFVRVAQAGSFSGAARALGMPVSTVSRRVAQLEERLGVPLLLRTTRSLKITDVGQAYLAHGTAIAAEIEKARTLATSLSSIPQGTLRLTATTEFGHRFLGPVIGEFLQANPRVDVDVALTERVVDLIGEGFDLAIRIGELDDSTHVARRIGSMDLQLYASPAFLKAHGTPARCADLSRFECIRFSGEADPGRWQLTGARGQSTTVAVSGRILANNMALIREFARAGRGIALMPHFLAAEDARAGELRVLLPAYAHRSGPIHVVYPGQRFLLPKVRAFIDHLSRRCEDVKWRTSPS